jgi:hypothetical protein
MRIFLIPEVMLSMPSPVVPAAPFFGAGSGNLDFWAAAVGREGSVAVVAFLAARGALGAGSLRGAAGFRVFLTGKLLGDAIVAAGELGTV